jgi:glutamate-1-semialdehyde 2,1-aminomutase
MQRFTPTGGVFELSTFNGHSVAMAAGLETLQYTKATDGRGHANWSAGTTK